MNAPNGEPPKITKKGQDALRKQAKARFSIEKRGRDLVLIYSPRNGAEFIDEFVNEARVEADRKNQGGLADWTDTFLNHDDEGRPYIRIGNGAFCFYVSEIIDALSDNKGSRTFRLGTLGEDGYYIISKTILGIKDDLKIHSSVDIDLLFFLTPVCNIPILQKIDKIIHEPIIVGGDAYGAIDQERFVDALRSVPTRWEVDRYVNYRVEKVVQDFFETTTDEEDKYQRYLGKHVKRPSETRPRTLQTIAEQELQKFVFLRQRLEEMLSEPDCAEAEWQAKILQFILFLFPRYVQVLEKVGIKEKVSRPSRHPRYFDLVLIDADGHMDLIEIKKPFDEGVLRKGKYRDNYIPARELTGAIMQAEKYLYYLQKGGYACEAELNQRYASQLLNGLSIKVVNPKAMVIIGRSKNFDEQQRLDFEIIRRKYSNVIDILTYDDLLLRLDRQIRRLQGSDTVLAGQ